MEYAGIGGLIHMGLIIWAVISILGSGASTGGKVLWTLLVVALPIVGFIIWLLAGPKGDRVNV